MNAITRKEFLGYLIVGSIGAALDFGVFYLVVSFGLPLFTAQWMGSSIGFIHNHLWHHYRIFSHNRSLGFTTTFSIMVAVGTIIISGPLISLVYNIAPNLLLSKFLVTGFTALISFLIRRRWIFSSK